MMPGGKQFKEPDKFIGNYIIDKTIGQGTYGKVKLGFHAQTKEKVAIKVIDKSTIENDRQVKRIQKEIRFLKLLSHPNIVKIYDVLETETHIFMVMEYASGGELFDYIVSHKRVKEKEARVFFRQILSALDYCHTNSVIHRDLKPENLLLDDNKNIKIIDFGFSNTFQPNHLLNTFCGSPFYAAPEMILGKRYEGPEVDMWSLGVILFALLCGHLPFDDDDVKELYRKISSASYVTPSYLSDQSKEIIGRMITVHPKKRATLEEIKKHPWVNEGYDGPPDNFLPPRPPLDMDNLDPDILEKMVSFGNTTEEILKALASETDTSPMRSTYYLIQEMFRREEERIKKLRAEPRIDATGRSSLDILGAISEDGVDDVPSITIPSSPSQASNVTISSNSSTNSGATKYIKILDDFSRPEPKASPTTSTRAGSTSPTNQIAGGASEPVIPTYNKGRRASTSAVTNSRPNSVVGPSKQDMIASAVAATSHTYSQSVSSTTSTSTSTSKTSSGEAQGGATQEGGEVVPPRGRRLSLPAIEYSKKRASIPSQEGETIPGIPGRIRTLTGWFSVATTSNKTVPEIVDEIKRVLQEGDITFEFDNAYLFVCEEATKKNPVTFEIEICKVTRMQLFGLHLKRIRGSIWTYKKICNKLLSQMVL